MFHRFNFSFSMSTEITSRRCLLSSHKFLNHTTFANPRQLRPLKQHSREFTSRRGIWQIGAYEVFRAVQHLKGDSHQLRTRMCELVNLDLHIDEI